MRMRWVVVMCAVIGCRPLGPGETRCTSTPVFGTMITHCNTGAPTYTPPVQEQEPRAPQWWCSSDVTRRLGACFRVREGCRIYRDGMVRSGEAMVECDTQTYADCFDVRLSNGGMSGICSPTPGTCREQRDYVLRNEPDGDQALSDCRSIE